MGRLLDFAEHLKTRGEDVHVGLVFEEGGVDGRVVFWVGGLDVYAASGERVLETHGAGDGGSLIGGGGRWEDAGLVFYTSFHAEAGWDQHDLQVRRLVVLEMCEGTLVLFALVRTQFWKVVFDRLDDTILFLFGGEELLMLA